MTAVDKRRYYLMLSPAQGQEFASDAGFSMPSEEVQEAEMYDVISRWAVITSTGLLEEVLSTADWFMDLALLNDMTEDIQEDFHKILVAHGVALVNKILDSEKAAIVHIVEDDDYE